MGHLVPITAILGRNSCVFGAGRAADAAAREPERVRAFRQSGRYDTFDTMTAR
jgi:hypothetical protein